MAIVLIVEDGTGVANANTYVDEATARVLAANVGLTLPTETEACKAALLAAMPYLESQPWQGHKVDEAQALSWPRNLVIANGSLVPSNVVPLPILQAQVQAASMIAGGVNLYPTISGQLVTKKKVGPIETEYSDEYLATIDGRTVFGAIDIYLQPYIWIAGGYKLTGRFKF